VVAEVPVEDSEVLAAEVLAAAVVAGVGKFKIVLIKKSRHSMAGIFYLF
jgi:hypothetical protein